MEQVTLRSAVAGENKSRPPSANAPITPKAAIDIANLRRLDRSTGTASVVARSLGTGGASRKIADNSDAASLMECSRCSRSFIKQRSIRDATRGGTEGSTFRTAGGSTLEIWCV